MGWTTPTSPSSGSAATSTWADIVAADLIFLAQKPYATAASTVGTSVSTSSWTQIAISSGFANYGCTFGSNAITVPTAGVYFVTGFVAWNQLSTTLLGSGIAVNGTLQFQTLVGTNGSGAGSLVQGIVSCTAGQSISLQGFQNSGSTQTSATTGSYLHVMYSSLT